jgi:tetratricopeptide (TPR) repeat protein
MMRVPERARWIAIGFGGGIVGGLLAGAIVLTVWPMRPGPVARATGLAPELASFQYRFTTSNSADPRREVDETIAALAARVKEAPTPAPFDLSELAELHVRRGQLVSDRRDYDRAAELANQSLAMLPAPNSATMVLAKLANARHDFREAIRLAGRHRSKSAPVHAIEATAYLALGDLVAAARAAHAAVAAKPDANTYLMRALVLAAQGRDREAAADFAAAVRVEDHGDPQGAARLRALWARFLIRRGELAGAAPLIDEAQRIAPEVTMTQAVRGELMLRSGKPTEAARQFEQAFATSRQVRYLMDQARALEAAGDAPNAEAVRGQVETIVRGELAEGGLGHRLDLAEVLIDRGSTPRLVEAIALAREEVANRPSAEARYQLARGLARSGELHGAAAEIQGALATGAREPQMFELASRIEKARGNAARAAVYAELAAELDPSGAGWRGQGMP